MLRAKQIGIVGFDGVTACHLTTLVDIFAAARLDDGFGGRIDCYRTWIVGLTSKDCMAESGLSIPADCTLQDAPPLDTLIVPGGSGWRDSATRNALAGWLLLRAPEIRRIGALGNGVSALAVTGMLRGREVTTHWRLSGQLQRADPTLRVDHKRALIKDGPIYTAAGLTAGVDLALALVEEDYGKHVSLAVSRELMLYLGSKEIPGDDFLAAQESRSPTGRFGQLVAWIMTHMDEDLTVEVMARQAGICPAHFTRAFKTVFGTSPGRFVENLRLNEAKRRLSSRGKTLHTVAASVGFPSTTAFTRAYQKRFGASPRQAGAIMPADFGQR